MSCDQAQERCRKYQKHTKRSSQVQGMSNPLKKGAGISPINARRSTPIYALIADLLSLEK